RLPLLQHRGQEPAVQAHRGEQVQVERPLPVVIGQGESAAARRGGTADRVDHNIETAQAFKRCLDHLVDALTRTDIHLDEAFGRAAGQPGPAVPSISEMWYKSAGVTPTLW